MHKGYKKTLAILITCALISTLICIPVSADSSYMPLQVDNIKIFTDILDNPSLTEFSDNSYRVTIPYNANKSFFASIWEIKNNITDKLCNYRMDISFINLTPSNLNVTFNNVKYSVTSSNGSYTFLVENQKNVSSSFRIETNFSFNSNMSGYIIVNFYYLLSTDNVIIDNQNENTDKVIENQNQNTQAEIDADRENTQDIIDNQNSLAEQEKQEITDSGNQSTDAMDSIPNESKGFINALGTFVSTMSTTDTACSITFPAIKTPSFAGIPAATLSDEKEVDFSTAISLIPSDIMRLIQALTTIALIVFCFKELYDTISEALTRKKANSDG